MTRIQSVCAYKRHLILNLSITKSSRLYIIPIISGSLKPQVTPSELRPLSYALFELRPWRPTNYALGHNSEKNNTVNFIELRPWGKPISLSYDPKIMTSFLRK